MDHHPPHSIVSTSWLAERMSAPDIVILDGSWHLPSEKRNARAEYAQCHLPGAVFFDIDDLSDEKSPLPHMLPSTIKFASRMKKMGIGDGARIVVYAAKGSVSAARVWWTFRAMGHADIAVLDGGLGKWVAEGRPVTDEPTIPRTPRHFTPRFNAGLVRDLAQMQALLTTHEEQIVDARSGGRFNGTEPEPRPGLRGGHIPGSCSIPAGSMFNADGTMKSPAELAAIFAGAGIDVKKPVVTTCGSGVTAAILSLALSLIGRPDAGLYDGSWAEWGQPSVGTPVATNS